MNKHFFIVGAQRSGTTLLYNMLDSNENICMAEPVRPEPKYFLNNVNIGYTYYMKKYFKYSSKNNILYGEKSTSYYELESCAQSISSHIPNAKIIFLLRNPIKRAISNFKFSTQNGFEKRSIEEVFLLNKKPPSFNKQTSVDPYNYLTRGNYIDYINMYLKYFKREQISVSLLEDLLSNTSQINNIETFLGVKLSTANNKLEKINVTSSDVIVPKEIINRLTEYYEDKNNQLASQLNIDISLWN